ncbi:hypothetical protein [Kiloniella sp. b19]|uniref:hypothetical protein n=1 Tax=Kiloniella sp. GXU_MW_B19 TaxID=3141326 RepID=UPI0031E07182
MLQVPSIGKLLILALVLGGIWLFYKAKAGREQQRNSQGKGPSGGGAAKAARKTDGSSVDMVQCPACQAYIPSGTNCSCGSGRS